MAAIGLVGRELNNGIGNGFGKTSVTVARGDLRKRG
jgi:hypothetical protein